MRRARARSVGMVVQAKTIETLQPPLIEDWPVQEPVLPLDV